MASTIKKGWHYVNQFSLGDKIDLICELLEDPEIIDQVGEFLIANVGDERLEGLRDQITRRILKRAEY